MSYSRRSRSRYSISPSPKHYRSISRSLSPSRSWSRDSSDAENPGNNLYVTGLSTHVTKRDLEKHFSTEGKVEDVHLVRDPWTRESRRFAFVTMSTLKEAERCIKYLDRSVLEGRVITVEKARRKRGRTPTPGRYLGLRATSVRRRSHSYSPYSRSVSPQYSSESDRSRSRGRSYSPYYNRKRESYSPYRQRSYSPYEKCGRSSSRTRSYSRSPVRMHHRDHSYSPYYYRDYSPDDRNYRRCHRSSSRDYYRRGRGSYRSISRSISPRYCYSPERRYYRRRHRSSSRDYYRRGRGRYRSISRSISPRYRRHSRRSYSRSV